MAKPGTRHANGTLTTFSDFTGGLNLSIAPESIGNNELSAADNFEFAPDTGTLRTRGGLSALYTFPRDIDGFIPISGGVTLVKAGETLWRWNLTSGIGTGRDLSEHDSVYDKPPANEFWGDSFQVLAAFGGKLWMSERNGDFAPVAGRGNPPAKVERLFVREGRVFVAETGSDTLRASGVGDPSNWLEDTDMDSVSVEVGYKDGCDIAAAVEFAGEIIVFKAPSGRPEWGRVYRLQGNYPDWSVRLYSRGVSAWNQKSVVSIPNDVLFLSRDGLMSLGTVTEYGDLRMGWAGSKVNSALAPTLSKNCRLWHLPGRHQAWASSGSGGAVWVYHYQTGAWTKFTFGGTARAVFDDGGGKTYIGIGNTLYVMNDGTPCERPASVALGTIVRRGQILIKGIIAGYEAGENAAAKLKLGGYELPLPSGAGIIRTRVNIRDWRITPGITVSGGAFSLSSLGLETAEV